MEDKYKHVKKGIFMSKKVVVLGVIVVAIVSYSLGYYLRPSIPPLIQEPYSAIENNVKSDYLSAEKPIGIEQQIKVASKPINKSTSVKPKTINDLSSCGSNPYILKPGIYRYGDEGYDKLLNIHDKNNRELFLYSTDMLVKAEPDNEHFIYTITLSAEYVEITDTLNDEKFRKRLDTYNVKRQREEGNEELYATVEEQFNLADNVGEISQMACRKYVCSLIFSATEGHSAKNEWKMRTHFRKIAKDIIENTEGYRAYRVDNNYNATTGKYYTRLIFNRRTPQERLEAAEAMYFKDIN
jgi:hypothetical protein